MANLPYMYVKNWENIPEHGVGLGIVVWNIEGWTGKNVRGHCPTTQI